MRTINKGIYFATILLATPFLLNAQEDSASKKTSHGQLGLKYLSNNVYLGRKDSAGVSYITPSLGYFSKSGFYINGSMSWLPKAGESRIDVVTVEMGYDFSIGDKFDGGVYAGKYFYNGESFAVNSTINTGLGFYGDYNFGALTLNSGLSLDLGSGSDYVVEGGLSHDFSLADDKLDITPSAKFNAGTQNYYNSYYTSGHAAASGAVKHGRGRGGSGSGSSQSNTHILEATQFKLLDFEIGLPFEYSASKFKFSFTPKYIIPENPATLVIGQTLVKEKISSSFIAEIEIKYKF